MVESNCQANVERHSEDSTFVIRHSSFASPPPRRPRRFAVRLAADYRSVRCYSALPTSATVPSPCRCSSWHSCLGYVYQRTHRIVPSHRCPRALQCYSRWSCCGGWCFMARVELDESSSDDGDMIQARASPTRNRASRAGACRCAAKRDPRRTQERTSYRRHGRPRKRQSESGDCRTAEQALRRSEVGHRAHRGRYIAAKTISCSSARAEQSDRSKRSQSFEHPHSSRCYASPAVRPFGGAKARGSTPHSVHVCRNVALSRMSPAKPSANRGSVNPHFAFRSISSCVFCVDRY